MSHAKFTPTTNEFIGTAAGHTIGMVIPNIDPEVRTLLKIPEQYSSLGILTSRTGAAAQAFSVDEAAKACNVELLIFELPRDTEGYSGHGNLIVLGAYDVSDARRAVEDVYKRQILQNCYSITTNHLSDSRVSFILERDFTFFIPHFYVSKIKFTFLISSFYVNIPM